MWGVGIMNDVRFVINRRKIDNYERLYLLQEEQKKFEDKIIFKIDIEDTCSLHFNYCILPHIELLIGTSIEALILQPFDVFTIHTRALEVLSKELNVKNIGVCVSEKIENLVLDKFERKRRELAEFQKNILREQQNDKLEKLKEEISRLNYLLDLMKNHENGKHHSKYHTDLIMNYDKCDYKSPCDHSDNCKLWEFMRK